MRDYQEYIKSDAWKEKRLEVLRDPFFGRANQCLVCSKSTNLNVHHLTYKRLKKERDSDLCILCKDCHNKVHDWMGTHGHEFNDTGVFILFFDNRMDAVRGGDTIKKPKTKLQPEKKGKTIKYKLKYDLEYSAIFSLYSFSKKVVKRPKSYSIERYVNTRKPEMKKYLVENIDIVISCFNEMCEDILKSKDFS